MIGPSVVSASVSGDCFSYHHDVRDYRLALHQNKNKRLHACIASQSSIFSIFVSVPTVTTFWDLLVTSIIEHMDCHALNRICFTCGASGSLNEPLMSCQFCARWLHFRCCDWFTPGSTPVCVHCATLLCSDENCEIMPQQDHESQRPSTSNAARS